MDTTSDSYSPKRSSISSLHKLHLATSAYSPNSKLSSPQQSPSPQQTAYAATAAIATTAPTITQPNDATLNTTNTKANNNSNGNPYFDLDKFTRYFIKRTFQIIVQSRINSPSSARTECKALGKDWFNLNIVDVPEVSSKIKRAVDTIASAGNYTIRSNWRVICEISLRTTDGNSLLLEYWVLSNKAMQNSGSTNVNTSQTSQTNNSTHSPSTTTNPSSSANVAIYSIYYRMSLMLRTLLSATHIVPAFQVANRGLLGDSQSMCYRIYPDAQQSKNITKPSSTSSPSESFAPTSTNINKEHDQLIGNNRQQRADTPNSSSNTSSTGSSSLNVINVHDFISPHEVEHFSQMTRLGNISSDISEIELWFCHRTDLSGSGSLIDKCRALQANKNSTYNSVIEDDCFTAAKKLLEASIEKTDLKTTQLEKPLKPAFAEQQRDPNLVVIESAFEGLLRPSEEHSDEYNNQTNNNVDKKRDKASEPILVPQSKLKDAQFDKVANFGPSSTPKSLTDSFVFVDLNVPFASDERGGLSSFFTGPSPVFNNNSFDVLKNHLADIEADANQLDEFVDTICASENDESLDSLTGDVDPAF